ncbi:DNA methyltransferase [Psychrobacter lutiphocae]|uniref:DNA methyltransferase n=1 Tax=Psychrobacter lutiphocae TaxID=540500 RepID=UPI0003627307|nr:DNA methyltransferase [Psychrobacter lutiphocae]
MTNRIEQITKGYKTAESRWARFGPYYAMFPVEFAFDVVNRYTKEGDYILDPFAGRFSSIYAASTLGRHGLGIEISPVGWLYGKVKLSPANKEDVIDRLYEIYRKRNYYNRYIDKMPEFYRLCYCDDVLKFLLFARNNLDWQKCDVDATLMSIILVYLHAKIGEGLSNQMRMTKSMGMQYSIDWWKKNGFKTPPKVNPLNLLLSKIDWRYKKGYPKLTSSEVIYADSTIELENRVQDSIKYKEKYSLLLTSPPYCGITDYHADQWLRLWMLGDDEWPRSTGDIHKGRFVDKEKYYNLLDSVFSNSSKLMKEHSTIYVRTDKRDFTYSSTLEILKRHFPNHFLEIVDKPLTIDSKTQTKLYGDKTLKPGEVDIILTR